MLKDRSNGREENESNLKGGGPKESTRSSLITSTGVQGRYHYVPQIRSHVSKMGFMYSHYFLNYFTFSFLYIDLVFVLFVEVSGLYSVLTFRYWHRLLCPMTLNQTFSGFIETEIEDTYLSRTSKPLSWIFTRSTLPLTFSPSNKLRYPISSEVRSQFLITVGKGV